MTGLHYLVKEVDGFQGMRGFSVRRSDQSRAKNIVVLLDADNIAHCGGCIGKVVTMNRHCAHANAVRRFVGIRV